MAAALAPHAAVLDGEVVTFDEKGLTSFQRLRRRMHVARPMLVVEIAYTEVTEGGTLRQPSIKGLRTDVVASGVTWDDRSPAPSHPDLADSSGASRWGQASEGFSAGRRVSELSSGPPAGRFRIEVPPVSVAPSIPGSPACLPPRTSGGMSGASDMGWPVSGSTFGMR